MNNPVKLSFEQALRIAGFVKHADTWYCECPETVLVAHLQKSEFGRSYYINLAIWVKALGNVKLPKEQHCHIRTRATAQGDGELERALDLEVEVVDRDMTIRRAMTEVAIPFLQSCSTFAGIRKQIVDGGLSHALVHKRVKELVGP